MGASVIRAWETRAVSRGGGPQGPEVQETAPSAHVGGCEVGIAEPGWLGAGGCRAEQLGLSVPARGEPGLGPHSLPAPPPPGDFAYNMDQDNARVGDKFMRLIEPVAASLPYMTCPGNHEER